MPTPNYLQKSRQKIQRKSTSQLRAGGGPVRPRPDETWSNWLRRVFATYVVGGFARRHVVFWSWVWSLVAGVAGRHLVVVWPRGGGKSTTAELACVAVAARRTRRYVLYVCETQEQANMHVVTIAAMMERAGFERELNKYGSSKGWRRQQLRAEGGFKIDAIGLDTAARGRRVDEDRPDLIILDDIDNKKDTPTTTKKKLQALTLTILPAMAPHGVVLAVQNLIIAHGVFARLVDGRADFLADRIVDGPHPAIVGLKTKLGPDGKLVISAGRATWAGQSLATCQHLIRTWGFPAFEREAQHKVGELGRYFKTYAAHHVASNLRWRPGQPLWASFDYGFGHNAAFCLFTQEHNGRVIVLGEYVARHQTVAEHCDGFLALLVQCGLKPDPKQISRIAAGPDIFKKDQWGKQIADDYAARGFKMSSAATDRVTGWHALRELFGNITQGVPSMILISSSCIRVDEFLDDAVADPDRRDDVLKFDCDDETGEGGDDAGDALRYGIMAAPVKLKRGWSQDDAEKLSSGRKV